MGSKGQAKCSCGFSQTVNVGGGMKNFLEFSEFPFYCNQCGLVSVNIAKDSCCPSCNNKEPTAYGNEAISTPTKFNSVLAWGEYNCGENGHLCPKCKNKEMFFIGGGICFD